MGLFKKIKNLFVKEESPIPSSDDFISGEKKDVEKILEDLGLTETANKKENSPDQTVNETHNPSEQKNEIAGSNISGLFFDEDEIDLDDLKQKSELEAKRSTGHSKESDSTKTNTDAFKEKIEENLKNAGSKIKDKGEKIREKLDSFLDDVEKKSAELDEIEKQEREKYSGPMEYRGKSLLDDKDDFFEKAKAFADGRPAPPKGMRIEENKTDKPNKEDKRKVYGFEDLDGDGDEIIDDAIIDEQE